MNKTQLHKISVGVFSNFFLFLLLVKQLRDDKHVTKQ